MNLIDVKNLLFKYKMYSGEKEEVIEHTAIDNISLSIKQLMPFPRVLFGGNSRS